MKQARGITLIALVITIIVMLILAGVSLNAVVGDNGIITNAMKASIAQKEAEIREKVEFIILDFNIEYIEKGKPADTLEDYIRDKVDKTEDGILKLPTGEIYVNEDGDLVYRDEDESEVILKTDENGNLVIDEIILNDGTDNKAPVLVEVKTTTDSITFTATDRVGITGYAITETDEEPKDWKEVTSTKKLTQTESGLTQGNTYYIWVKDEAGNVSEYKKVKTIILEALTNANTTFTYNPEGWVNGGTVTVTASSSLAIGELTLQTSKDTITWNDTATQSFTANGTMYARLIDTETQSTSAYVAANVDCFDTTKPVVTEAEATTNSITITATDEASGIIEYAVTETTTEPTSFTSCANTKLLSTTVTGKTQGITYYVWVKDEAGNISNYKSTATGSVEGLTNANTTFTYSSTNWRNSGTVTVTASSSLATGEFTLQTSKDAIEWSDTATQSFTANGTMYARLVDNANQAATGYASASVDCFDTTKPVVTGATVTTNSITITATDEASGIIGYTVTESTAEPTSFTSCENTKSLSTTVTGKAQGTTYYIWVKDEAGNISNYGSTATNTVTGATSSNLQVSSTTWSGTNATVTFTTTTDYTIQLSTDNSTWNAQSSITVATGTTIYARLVDNANQAGTSYMASTPVLTYTISYDGNGSTGGSTSSSTHSYGTAKELTANGYTKTGYAFQGWATSASGTVVYTDKQSVNNLASTNGATVTLYAVWLPIQPLASQITSANYGDYVNYSKDLGLTLNLEGESTLPKTDWRIFYEDTAQDRVYLIASDYVPNTSSLLKLSSASMTKAYTYNLYWSSVPSALSAVARQDSIFGITTSSYTLNASNANSKCVSNLLDTSHWSNFVDTAVADYAIGGPTIEMYTNSWNAKGYTTLTPSISTHGYKVNGANSVSMSSDKAGYGNNLYYPHKSAQSSCYGYWLAAPSADNASYVMYVRYYGDVNYNYYDYSRYGVRPVVSLKSGIKATKDANGIWQLGE